MTKHKHLTLEDRMNIEAMLNDKTALNRIAEFLSKDHSTISKEIRRHLVFCKGSDTRISIQRLH